MTQKADIQWVCTTKDNNPRLKKAKKESKEYLEKAAICFKDKKTKYRESKKVNIIKN